MPNKIMCEVDNSLGCKENIFRKQRNHENYYLPSELSHLGSPRLYMAVAYWGMMKGEAMSRDYISQVFHITPRRASDIMNYIHNDRQEVITSHKSIEYMKSGQRVFLLKIISIKDSNGTQGKSRKKTSRNEIASKDTVQKLRHWFLSRPNMSNFEQ